MLGLIECWILNEVERERVGIGPSGHNCLDVNKERDIYNGGET